ncbi:MAG: hypothetical protein PHH11_07820, partial [Methylomonas sp.]|nr:hypothetical protein [Methylomonas sp.]
MKLFQSLSMTKRFNLLNAALVLLTALCVGFIVAYALLTRQFEARQDYNQALADLLAETSEYAVYTHQNALLESQLARLKDLPGLAYIMVLDAEGRTLAELKLGPALLSSDQADKASLSINFWRWWVVSGGQGFNEITQAISSKGFLDEEALFLSAEAKPKVIGQVRIAMNLAYFESILINTFVLALAVVLVILVFSVAVSLMMTARITSPLKQLGAAAHEVIEGQLTPI